MYKPEVKNELLKLLMQFYNEEQGNKVTTFNMNGLTGAVNQLFGLHEVKKGKKKSTGKET